MNKLSLISYSVIVIAAGTLFAACQRNPMSSTPTSAPTSAEGQTVPTAAPTVTIQSMNFAPAHIEVKVGQTVTWVNQDQVPHTVTSDTGEFDSGQMANGASFSFTFSEAGTYHYHCQLHPAMTGQITVTQ